ncbi:two-component system activity regulator YycH [Lactobacillus sp. PV034]|uniref:two-component system activity regulator YycH n=1 Tax=Lactobacillus sp. PV034 TaxID=2594495 RepID=UPI00224081A9|nr:two-component system activity regulator YycH [Lactobacillus sp. PV034]QNQ81079.1 hypothetical protein FP432_05660 [Lactobacillus sp. PV034]
MNFNEHTKRIILRISLIFMVLLSIGLTGYIFGTDAHFSGVEQTTSKSADKELGEKSLRDIFVPTQLFYYQDDQLYQVYDGNKNLPLEFNRLTEKLDKRSIKNFRKDNDSYKKMLHNHNYLQLTYPDQITMPLFIRGINKKDGREFNRIFVSTKKRDYLYLGNDANHHLYQIKISDIAFDKFVHQVTHASSKIPVSLIHLRDGYSVVYEKATKLQVYNYLTNEESSSYYVNNLLGSGASSQKTTGDNTVYSNGAYQRLIVTNKTHHYEFVDYQENKIPKLMTTRLIDSLYYVRKTGLSEPDLRFFDADNKTFIYQNFVEEYPIFLPGNNISRAKVNFAKNGMSINFNSLDFQIPVPTDDPKVTVESTDDALDELYEAGYTKKDINRIIIGYQISQQTPQTESRELVELHPTYYVKINNKWRSLKEWTSLSTKSRKGMGLKEETNGF